MGIPEPKYIDIQRAASRLTSEKQPVTDKDVIELILDGHLQCYAYDTDKLRVSFDGGITYRVIDREASEPLRLSNPKRWIEDHYCEYAIWATWPTVVHTGLYDDPENVEVQPSEKTLIGIERILLLTIEVIKLKAAPLVRQH